MKTLDLKNYKLHSLDASEEIQLNGGGSDFAFDFGSLCRFTIQKVNSNYAGMGMTVYNWCLANGLK